MSPVWLVARREIRTRVRTRGFIIGTLSIIVIMGAYAGLMTFIGNQASTTKIGVTAEATAIGEPLKAAGPNFGKSFEISTVPAPVGEQQVRDGDLEALITGTPEEPRLVVKRTPDDAIQAALNAIVQQRTLDAELARFGLDPAAVRATAESAHVAVTSLETEDPHRVERLVLAIAAGVVLYMFMIIAGQMVAQGVVEEKASRVVELLLSTIKPTQLLAGKVVGIGLTNLLQLLIIAGAGLLAAGVGGMLTLPSAALASTLAWALVWFVLGFFTYATVLAAASSLVSRHEELQNVISPVIMVLVVPFVIGVSILPSSPDSTFAAVLSLVPGFSPTLMPMRIALGVAAPWEIAVATVLSIAAIAVLLRLGGRIYSNAVLRTGSRVKIRDALRAS
ncbi:ABC transporter permease [Saccharopolyspora spinosa]|uniref:ABC-2 type transport system permease protein n=1 Tax=Saccharopolyspora spinosa TaxID=60894 RepID=A0A2N3XTN6_SACSN|nr:ABC transporter permease [Saccharopolyspora spinosa]PKW14057.1 ABC-2 type transport system permease protein [Saccharopolyspora spinosa]